MKQRLSALTALCLTGVLVLSTVAGATETDQTAPAEVSDTAQTDTAASDDAAATDTVNDTTQQPDTTTDVDNADATPPSESEPGDSAPDGAEEPGTDETNTVPADETEPEETEENEENPQEQQPEDEIEELQQDEAEQKVVGSYQGITIDGDFSDWDAVAKTSVNENKGWDTVDEVAMVWDGDYVYLYFMAAGNGDGAGDWGSVCNAGPYNSGQYAITTDLGYTMLIQLIREVQVAGVDGAQVAVNNKEWFGAPHMWEAAIPSSELPNYKNTISFGIYQSEPVVKDVANLQGTTGDPDEPEDPDKEFNGVVCDGQYGDWKNYPHKLIQYATQGTHENEPDGEAALYSANGKLYAHVVTRMQRHLEEAGGEFTAAVTIRINSDKDFYPQFVTVDAAGNINYNPQLLGLDPGTYEFYLIDSQGWKKATNISQFEEADSSNEYGNKYHNDIYGKMYVTISESEDNMEFEVDLTTLTEKFGMEPDNIETLHGQWGRIGPQWVTTAGTPTGAGMGIFLCLSTTGVAYLAQRRRKKQG